MFSLEGTQRDRPKLAFVKSLFESLKNHNIHVEFDSFFPTTFLEALFQDGIYATATIHFDRKTFPVLARKNSRLNQGEFRWRTKYHINYVQWQDKKRSTLSRSTLFQSDQSCWGNQDNERWHISKDSMSRINFSVHTSHGRRGSFRPNLLFSIRFRDYKCTHLVHVSTSRRKHQSTPCFSEI